MLFWEKAKYYIDRVYRTIFLLFEIIGLLAIIGLMCVLVIQTIAGWFSISILWSDEIATLLNVWLIFSGAAVVAYKRKHVKVDFFSNMLPERMKHLLDALISLMITAICVYIITSGKAYLNGTRNMKTTVLHLPMYYTYIAPIISIVYILMISIYDTVSAMLKMLNLPQ